MEYKTTLNLPKTDFPMKADLPKREPLLLERWNKEDIYSLIQDKSKGREKYILHDGPPYANGDIHIGHALNKTLKDIIIKYKTMRGFSSPYVPGWDCHGLPVEHQLLKELGITKYQISQLEFRKKAHDYALKYVSIQREQFIRLGIFGDWQHPYLTLLPEYEEGILTSLADLVKKGYIYHGLKPVNWCCKCETALAEAEVEYENHVSPSVFVKFRMDESKGFGLDSFLLIWTTTPWTLIANVAVAVHPGLTYYYIKTGKGNLIIAKDLFANVLSCCGIEKYEIIKEITGKDLEGLSYAHPFGLRKGRVVLADYVSREDGSGLVHTAPGHGMEDYATGLKYGLDIIMPVDGKGNFDASAGEFKGLHVFEANKLILEKLQSLGALLFSGQIQHSYPHCWRCKKPVIFRATKQWFLKIGHNGMREKLLGAIQDKIIWVPESGKSRIAAMVETRPDWCLSRQRYWGVPIPALVCNNCKEEILNEEVIRKYAEFSAKEGSDCWFIRDIKDFLPPGLKCRHCAGVEFSKGNDILDVWFDSGVSNQAVLKKREGLRFPADLYLEGSDQHRGWFQSSLIPSMCIDGLPAFKSVLTHGFVVDGEGKKMSKSLGNVISPVTIIKDYGVDILRLWVASSDYNEDIRISKEILTRLSEAYRKIRNTAKFILSNLFDFYPDVSRVDYGQFRKIDKWILWRMHNKVLPCVEKNFDNFEFYKAYKEIYDFCNGDLSMYYLDMVKGRLYTCAAGSKARRAAQTVLYDILNTLVRMAAPIFVFTAEEIWQCMPKGKKQMEATSVHLLEWPKVDVIAAQPEGEEGRNSGNELCVVLAIIPDVAKALEEKRSKGEIGSSFDAKIKLLTNNEIRYKYLSSLRGDLCEIFKVSEVEVISKDIFGTEVALCPEYSDIAIDVSHANGLKCERCWNYSLSVGTHDVHPLICDRCVEAIGGK